MLGLLPSLLALGISPGKTIINYTPNVGIEIPITTYNGGESPLHVKIIKGEGDLTQYVYCDREEDAAIEIPAGSGFYFDCRITVPEALSPGEHYGYYGIVTVTPVDSDAMITFQTGSLNRVQLIVPYPEKYLLLQATVEDVVEGEDLPYTLSIQNLGQESIDTVIITVQVLDSEGALVLEETVEGKALVTNEQQTLEGMLETSEFQGGVYTVQVVATYDEKQTEYTDTVSVGNKMLMVTDFPATSVSPDTISRIALTVESNWIEEVQGYAELVFLQEGTEAFRVKTDTQTISPLGNTTLSAFIEPTKEGTYDIQVTTYAIDGTTSTKSFEEILRVEEGMSIEWLSIFVIFGVVTLAAGAYILKKRRS